MIIVINPKKTVVITSIGICLVGTLYAALKFYFKSTSKNKKLLLQNSRTKQNSNRSSRKLSNEHQTKGNKNNRKLIKPNSSSPDSNKKEVQKKSICSQDTKNIPAEELLELGLNYLHQAIKSWENALDSIESAEYMQSHRLALPNNEHADLVFKLRNLVESANNITLNCGPKLIKSSQTLQIIQSKLALKQQLYTEALLKQAQKSEDTTNNNDEYTSPVGSLSKRYGYLSDEDNDNESFVSADSDVDWLTEEMLQNIENFDEKNVLYEMAMSNVVLGRVKYRISRADLLECKSEEDFAAKVHVVRLGFDRIMQDSSKKQWFIDEGKNLLASLFRRADKDFTGLFKAYDEMIRFVSVESNWRNIKDELATRDVQIMNFYDIALDFILLDAFEDLESPPSAITAVIQNRWLSQSFKETALATAVWSVLKAKRKLLKYPDGLITRFYSINEYLVPVLAWGFLGTDPELNQTCTYLKNQVIDYLKCLFDLNRTRYTNLEDLSNDIEIHTIRYLKEVSENI